MAGQLRRRQIFGSVAWTWEEDTRVGWPDENIIFQNLDAINQTDIEIGYRNEQWEASGYVENVFDNLWYDAAYDTGCPLCRAHLWSIEISYHWR